MTALADTRRFLGAVAIAYLCTVLLSLGVTLSRIGVQYKELAVVAADAFCDSAVALRQWGASTGGVYVPTEHGEATGHPALVRTTSGLELTEIDPSKLVRLIAEHVRRESGIGIHLTSLRPHGPATEPAGWERRALKEVEARRGATWSLDTQGNEPVLRYVAPLYVQAPCLGCHPHGEEMGGIRGGVSVTMPYNTFALAERRNGLRAIALHGLFLFLGLGLFGWVGGRLHRSVRALEESQARVRTLEGFLPICAHCKKIRKEGGSPSNPDDWDEVENYIGDRVEASFSHSICPECLAKYYSEEGSS